jgi:hypothetical protein
MGVMQGGQVASRALRQFSQVAAKQKSVNGILVSGVTDDAEWC